jgi:hypothetical protein
VAGGYFASLPPRSFAARLCAAGLCAALASAAMAQKAEAVLEALAAASPAELAGAVSLRALHARCLAVGMRAATDAASDVQRLHDLFDLALDSNLVAVVVHYVLEVRPHSPPAMRRASPPKALRPRNPDD